MAVTLQRAVLGPTALPEGFAVHYEPASGTLEVGGDWYDVVDLPDGRYGVVVGDVVGRGLAAAAVMGQLRSAGRALLLESQSPAQYCRRSTCSPTWFPGRLVSTVFCAVIDRAGTLRYSSAGHPPAILVQADGTSGLLQEASSLPLPSPTAGSGRRPTCTSRTAPRCSSTPTGWSSGGTRRSTRAPPGRSRCCARPAGWRRRNWPTSSPTRLLADAPDDDVAFLLYRCG